MAEYRVQWTFDVEADDPVHAAQKAKEAMCREGSIADVFDVNRRTADGLAVIDNTYKIDLTERTMTW